MTKGFLSDEILADYASGALSAGMSLLVASHLTYSAEARRRVAALESVGGALFDTMDARELEGVTAPSLDATLALLDDDGPRIERSADFGSSTLPGPLRDALGMDEDQIPWKFRLPGLSEYELDGFEGEEVSLLRARPGAPIFAHTHSGIETTLVMSGEMEDRGRVLRRGDISVATDEDDHRPRIVGTDVCVCLIVMTGNLRFTGPFSRALNIFAE